MSRSGAGPRMAFGRLLALAILAAASPVGVATAGVAGPQGGDAAGDAAGPQTVSGERLDELTREVGSQLRCVVCQGLSIDDSPSELAQQMKSVVREQLAAGRSPAQVKRYFVDTYGEWILLEPQPEGFNLAVYLLPVLALAGGAGVVIVAVRRWTRSPDDGATGRADGG